MWVKASGYVISAVLAGAICAGGLQGVAPLATKLIVIWCGIDLCASTTARGVRLMLRPRDARASHARVWRHAATTAAALAAGLLLAFLMPDPVRQVMGLTVLVSVVTALAKPAGRSAALLLGIQVSTAWAAAYLLAANAPRVELWTQPALWLGVSAGVGTCARLWYALQQRPLNLWVTRLSWAALLAALLAAHQPLLAGLVVIAACGDDLYRLQPVRRGDAGGIGVTVVGQARGCWCRLPRPTGGPRCDRSVGRTSG